ncbi:MAG: pirin family protein [Actinomycetota bacterium]|nr:pirin family protein [Actinomycetota bacterium]
MGAALPELLTGRAADLGDGTFVTRLLPTRRLRTVGPWCFLDSYRLSAVGDLPGMQVAPHPHVGLETVTFLVDGQLRHRDSLGSDALVGPGEVSLMTAGAGIVHSERSPGGHGPVLHGVQLWAALPDHARGVAPAYRHATDLPTVRLGASSCRVLLGSFARVSSPLATRAPGLAVELVLRASAPRTTGPVALDPSHEHVVIVLDGSADLVSGGTRTTRPVGPGELVVPAAGTEEISIESPSGARLLLLGGPPLGEEILVWWNFVARSSEEIGAARARWEDGGFGSVPGDDAPPVPAPPLPSVRLRARR